MSATLKTYRWQRTTTGDSPYYGGEVQATTEEEAARQAFRLGRWASCYKDGLGRWVSYHLGGFVTVEEITPT